MGRYSKESHWSDISIRKMACTTCYVESAITGSMWKFDELESKTHGREYGSHTGKYRKMVLGSLPDDTSCSVSQKGLEGGNIKQWRDHPFWPLLRYELIGYKAIELALKSVKGKIRQHIWSEPTEGNKHIDCPRIENSFNEIKAAASYKNFNALVTLTAWAREARMNKNLRTDYQAALSIRKIFAEVVCNTPHLFARWPLLADRYRKLIWAPPTFDHSQPWMWTHWELLIQEMAEEEKLARSRGVPLPPKPIFRIINKKDLHLLQ